MKNIKRILFFVLVFCLSLTDLSWAGFKVSPSISLREEYNDNIFLTPRDEEDDFITNIYPAINISYNSNLLTLSLDYGLNFWFYADHPDLNETNTQRAKLETTLSPYKDIFFIRVFDEYQRVTIDERRQVALDNIFVNLTDSNRFLINPYFEYPLSGTLKARIGYSYENIWYKAKEGDDTDNHLATVSLIKELTPKISTSLSYSYSVYNPKRTEDYDRQNAILGINYQVSPKLTLNGEIGQTWFDYEKTGTLDSLIGKIQANYLLTEIISLSAGYSISFLDSVEFGTYKSKAATASLTRQGNIPITLSVFKKTDTYLTENREDKSTGVALNSNLPITPRITGGLIGTYTNYEFLPEQEKVKRYGLGLSFDYALRITTVTFGYTHNWNNSTVDNNNYRNNIIWVQARFTI